MSISLNLQAIGQIFSACFDGVLIYSWETKKVIYANDKFIKLAGYLKDEICKKTIFDIEFYENRDAYFQNISKIAENKKINYQSRIKTKSGNLIYVNISSTFIESQNYIISFIQEPTQNQNIEILSQFALEASNIAAWQLDLRSGEAWRSENHDLIFGHPKNLDTWTIDTFLAHVCEEDRESVQFEMKQNLKKSSFTTSFRIQRKNDFRLRWIEVRARTMFDEHNNPSCLIGIVRDITDEKVYQEKLSNSSKMAALGEMAAGIAHEINNPLAIIIGKAFSIKNSLTHFNSILTSDENANLNIDKLTLEIQKIEDTGKRIAKIINGLNLFTRNSDAENRMKIQMRQILDETLEMCREKLNKYKIQLRVVNSIPELELECRPTQISQVILNLLNNSIDAIKTLDEPWVEIKILRHTNRVVISVTDCGKGIPENIISKIMEPFFTTKPTGSGTGLGLSISRRIINEHGWELNLNEKSYNTQFLIEIPIQTI